MAANNAGRSIFISYRRADAEGEAGRLFDDLTRAYGDASVFMDVSGIEPGVDFRKAIDANVSGCGVLLAVIGPSWATVASSDGSRRLDSPDDYVRLEIATALGRGIPVIPVLVHEAHMPALELLPDNLKELRYRNSVELTHARWSSDVTLLIAALKNYVAARQSNPAETVHATVPVQLPAPQAPASAPNEPPRSRMPVLLGIGAGVLLLAGVVLAMMHSATSPQLPPDPTPVQQEPDKPVSGKPRPVVANVRAAMLGKWQNSAGATGSDNLEQIAVSEPDGQLMVEAWGACAKGLCDWGPKAAVLKDTTAVTEAWELTHTPQEAKEQRSAVLSIRPSGNELEVTVHNTYHMPNGATTENLNPLQFVKMP